MIRATIHQLVLICGMLTALPSVTSAEMPSAERFAELLNVARGHAGSATFIDAEATELRDRAALNFLFRTEKGVLVSVALDAETAAVLSASNVDVVEPVQQNFLGRVAAFLNGGRPTRDQAGERTTSDAERVADQDTISDDQNDDSDNNDNDNNDGRSSDKGNDPDPGDSDSGRDRGGGQNGGPGNGNGRR